MKKRSRIIEFVIKVFFIAFAINLIVSVTVIHFDTNIRFYLLGQTIIFIAGVSLASFFPVCLLIFLFRIFNISQNSEIIYWIIMYVGVLLTGLIFNFFRESFSSYNEDWKVFAMIAIFSIMVSITSQYQFYINSFKEAENDIELET